MMLYHTRGVEDLWQQGAGALKFLDLVAGAATDELQAKFLRGCLSISASTASGRATYPR